MALWIVLGLGLGLLLGLATPRPQTQAAQPQSFERPKASEGEPVHFLFGTIVQDEPSVTWVGNVKTIPVKSKGGKK